MQKNKDVFKLEELPVEEYAASLGLPGAPKIKFLNKSREEARRKKNAPRGLALENEATKSQGKKIIEPNDQSEDESGSDGELHESSEEEEMPPEGLDESTTNTAKV